MGGEGSKGKFFLFFVTYQYNSRKTGCYESLKNILSFKLNCMDKILVVDDDFDILTLVKMSLSLHGFSVEATPRWEDVDHAIHEFWPDLILLDVSLAGADGREICKKIKTADDTRDIPIILFSANAEMEKSIHSCNAQAFIAKPYELSNLLQTIRRTIDANKQGPPGEHTTPPISVMPFL